MPKYLSFIMQCTIEFLVYSPSCVIITAIYLQNIFTTSPQILNPSEVTPHYPSLPHPWKPLSISMDFPMLDSLYKWSHIIYGLLWLASFTWCFQGSLRLSHVSVFYYFFHCWTVCTTCVYYVLYHMCLFIPLLMAIWLVSILWLLWRTRLWTFM